MTEIISDRPIVSVVRARQPAERYRHSSSGEYYALPLPQDITKYGFEAGDSVYLSLETPDEVEEVRYLKVSREESSRHKLKIRRREDRYPEHFLTLPIEYSEYNKKSPFRGIEKDDEVVVEITPKESAARIYRREDYQMRHNYLAEKGRTPELKAPVIIPLLDLSWGTGHDGQVFHIASCNTYAPELLKIAESHKDYRYVSEDEIYEGHRDHYNMPYEDVKQYHYSQSTLRKYLAGKRIPYDLPLVQTPDIRIEWNPNPDPTDDTNLGEMQSTTLQNIRLAKVKLPKRGKFVITTSFKNPHSEKGNRTLEMHHLGYLEDRFYSGSLPDQQEFKPEKKTRTLPHFVDNWYGEYLPGFDEQNPPCIWLQNSSKKPRRFRGDRVR